MGLFFGNSVVSLPENYAPTLPPHLEIEKIVLSRGSVATGERRRFVQGICALFPKARIVEQFDKAHNKIDCDSVNSLERHFYGKRTLVFGELNNSVRHSTEEGNTCPNYWHFSIYGFCPYDCLYCYLAGTPSSWFSPAIKIYVNIGEIISKIDKIASAIEEPTSFYLGKLQDGLALDPLTGYSTLLVPFFGRHKYARWILLTKSASVGNLLNLEHRGHTILSWSLNPPEVSRQFELNVPTVAERLNAMKQAVEAGYPVRAVIMPVIPIENWQTLYARFIEELLASIPIQRLTVGGICSYEKALFIMEQKAGTDNLITKNLENRSINNDGRRRYGKKLRTAFYEKILIAARKIRPSLELALCLEEEELLQTMKAKFNIGACNCIL